MAQAESGHRARLLEGMAAALAERPYAQVTVADVVRLARTSRRTFYENFADKQQCLVALIEDSHQRIVAAIGAAVDDRAPWPTQVRQAIGAWIDSACTDPETTLHWIRVVPALGLDARALMRQTLAAYGGLIQAIASGPAFVAAGIAAPSSAQTTMLLGALRELIATTVEDDGEVAAIVDVATEFTIRVLTPRLPAPPGLAV